MTLISNFELLVKRIAPTSGNASIDAPFRRVVQGYFLHISNPNNRPVNFRIRAHFPAWTTASPDTISDRELVNRNHIYTYDITGGSNNGQNVYERMRCRSIKKGSRSLITRGLTLGARQTAAFKLLPDLNSGAVDLADPKLEVRGYLEIAQLRPFFGTQPAPKPIDLLFTPETRGTFLDNLYPNFSGNARNLDFDQIAYSMPTSTGAALMNVSKLEYSLIICGFIPDVGTFDVPELVIEDKLDFEEDFQGYRFLSSKGNKQLQNAIQKFTKKHKEVKVDMSHARQRVEEILNKEKFEQDDEIKQ